MERTPPRHPTKSPVLIGPMTLPTREPRRIAAFLGVVRSRLPVPARVSMRLTVAATLTAGVVFLQACRTAAQSVEPPETSDAAHGPGCEQGFDAPEESPFVLPFPPGKSYTLEQGYCPPDPRWGHSGIYSWDFDMAIGDTIIAARAGVAVFLRDSFPNGLRRQGTGNFVFIEHADGTVLQYAHLDQDGVLVELGEEVEQGQPIGISGDSGWSSGPHLHLGLFRSRPFSRENLIPFNFRNAAGPHEPGGGLVQGERYRAEPFTPDRR